MASLRVGLVQARSWGADPDFARREGERACREAAGRGADLVLSAEPVQRAAWLAHATANRC
jgi:predicted amidohydrolase